MNKTADCAFRRWRSRAWWALLAAGTLVACGSPAGTGTGTGVADSDVHSGDSNLGQDDATADVTTADDTGADVTAPEDAGAADGAAPTDSGNSDGGPADSGPADTGPEDVFEMDTMGPGCAVKCEYNQVCEAGKCEPLVLPCNGQCKDTDYCDQANGPPGICKPSGCALPFKWGPGTQKISEFLIAATSQGCDLNGDKKPDNMIGNLLKVYPDANVELMKSVKDGLFNMLLEAPNFDNNGGPFDIAVLVGDLDPSNLSCPPVSESDNCKWKVDDENYKPAATGTCPPQVLFTESTVKMGELIPGGKGQKFTITLPIVGGLKLTIRQATLQGYVVGESLWKSTTTGKVCGVITEQDLNTAIDVIPADAFQTIGLSKDQVKALLGVFLKPDVDTNKDGVPDALSTAMLFKSVPGQITGIQY